MSQDLCIYAKPAATVVELVLDNGTRLTAGTTSANGRDDAHLLTLPSGTSGQGAVLTVSGPERVSQRVRGIAAPSDVGPAMFLFDDFGELAAASAPGPEPEPPPDGPPDPDNPSGIINWVYATGDYDLSTHDGCGQFTEACCEQLHEWHSDMWGHIAKSGGQNQYNGHAVDAVMLLAGPECGIYDIVHDSVAPTASPQYIYKGPPDPNLWYYDASAAAAGAGGTPQTSPLILGVLTVEDLVVRARHTRQGTKK